MCQVLCVISYQLSYSVKEYHYLHFIGEKNKAQESHDFQVHTNPQS